MRADRAFERLAANLKKEGAQETLRGRHERAETLHAVARIVAETDVRPWYRRVFDWFALRRLP